MRNKISDAVSNGRKDYDINAEWKWNYQVILICPILITINSEYEAYQSRHN